MEQNDASLEQPTAEENGAGATPENGSELESDCPSATGETQQQPNAVVQGKEMGETNETADDNRKKETLTAIPPTPMESQRLNTGKSLLTWEWERRGWCQKEEEPVKIQVRLQKELVDMGTLFAQKYFQLYSIFNEIVNYTLSSGFSGSGLIPIGGMSLFPI